ncbi:hypothetical protein BJ138DRAFT_985364, partial [Hygrophoropsis aurantiaca]
MAPWSESTLNQLPTLEGLANLQSVLTFPASLSQVDDIDTRWKSTLIAFLAHGLHTDGEHIHDLDSIHPLAIAHYRSGKLKWGKSTKTESLAQWQERAEFIQLLQRTIYDLCTLKDRLTGGTTIVMHHPGATEPDIYLAPENLKADVFVDPRMLAKHPELHAITAEMVQLFIEHWACVNAADFRVARTILGWSKGDKITLPHTTPKKSNRSLPLIPAPFPPSSNHFTFNGRAAGVLQDVLSAPEGATSYIPIPGLDIICWQIVMVPTKGCVNPNASVISIPQPRPAKGKAWETPSTTVLRKPPTNVIVIADDNDDYPDTDSNTFSSTSKSNNPSTIDGLQFTPTKLPALASRAWPDVTAASTSSPVTPSGRSRPRPIQSFGDHTAKVIRNYRLPDKLHRDCFRLAEEVLSDWWAEELKSVDGMTPTISDKIVNTRRVLGRSRAPRVRPSPEILAQLNQRRSEKRLSEEHHIREVLDYIDMKATELSVKFHQPRRRYLERFYVGSATRRRRHSRTSAWSAFLHFQGEKENADKANGTRSNIRELVKNTADYQQLMTSQREALIEEFDRVKANARKKAPTISAKSRNAECSSSFKVIQNELGALKARLGTEAFVILVRGSVNHQMEPKIFVTGDIVDQFLKLYLWKDPMEIALKFESAVLADGVQSSEFTKAAIRSGLQIALGKLHFYAYLEHFLTNSLANITKNSTATMEYSNYEEAIVRRWKVKLVGWTHNEWGNPSNLKGGLSHLETLAVAVSEGTCHFVRIDQAKINDREHRITAGEVLTPESEPRPSLAAAASSSTSVSHPEPPVSPPSQLEPPASPSSPLISPFSAAPHPVPSALPSAASTPSSPAGPAPASSSPAGPPAPTLLPA